MGRLAYLANSLARTFDRKRAKCPNCGSATSDLVARKYLVTALRRCRSCALMFRTPTDPANLNEAFYEESYSQGFTTDLPDDRALQRLVSTNFASSEKDYSAYIAVLSSLGIGSGARLFDFGCSWGYGSYQLAQAGLFVTAFEIAPTRSRYAREKLGVNVLDQIETAALDQHRGQYDCFFSSHVIEHVPVPHEVFTLAQVLLREGGLFVSFTPNGSEASRRHNTTWSKAWGEVHPHFIDDIFLDTHFGASPRVFGSSPISRARLPAAPESLRLDDLSRGELFFAARKVGPAW
ncbi:class I SAM-dependent methyltransferase [Aquabacter spiritensis]|uniref:Methyltransferase family protein n=1 Tax=Aquabacter spiritensis TaxID=933073 RepID=A0A4R3M731_9HYPH|nr:methyltransferase domain-containing protein [Aquabacter spiritensis]TCT08069.1 methyltransferase family protein [Aquabacter spiritensis]